MPDNAEELDRLRADNARLRLLLDRADAPAELRHRMRSTIALLRQVITRSADRAVDIEDYVAHLLDRIDAIAQAQSAADDRGAIDLHSLIADTLHRFRIIEGERLRMSGPAVKFNAKPGQALALAIHELALNAVQHGSLGVDLGQLDIHWEMKGETAGRALAFTWRETGSVPAAEKAEPGFGTEVLEQLLPYELKAAVALKQDAGGLSCVIRLPWHERLGAIEPSA